ncbi:putative Pentatricopeptide repeat-containing protein [Abeliophyllum distichum]|uniref:Pentatricopeptide repeat-containing protein n=1 Tax=Abeliophyllum distichum TaxID=126358 RepID=A0ABD1P8F6_9LAMI
MKALKEGLRFHAHAIKYGFTPTIFAANQLIHLYSKHGFVREARKLFDEMPERNVFTWNAIINTYVKSHNFTDAQFLFDYAPCKDSVTYNSLISGYANCDGHENWALNLFVQMQYDSESATIDEFTLTTLLNLIAKLRVLCYGRQLHSFMVKSGNDSSGFLVSSLIDMYSKSGCYQDAWRVFKGSGGRGVTDVVVKNAMVAACCRDGELELAREIFLTKQELNDSVTWNTMISGYVQNGGEEEAIKLFKCMAKSGFNWNHHTFAIVLNACSTLKNLKFGKEFHAWVLKEGLWANPFIASGIVDVYCKCGNMGYAESVHKKVGMDNSFSITSMIVGYSTRGSMLEARRLFDSFTQKNIVVWTAMFSGYVKSQQYEDVFHLFHEFQDKEIAAPDALVFVSLLCACTMQANMDLGKQIHAYILKMGIKIDEKTVSALIDMYSKCGNIRYAERIFQRARAKDSVIYNVMIAGYAHHGYEYEAINLFEEMKEASLQPDAVTFVAILSACRHCGLVAEGEKYFSSMTEDYAISPEIDHYACMLDLYGRSNQLEKAVAFIENMPIEPDSIILGTFINACKMNRNLELARMAENKLLEIEADNGARYVQLANVYASEGKWDEMRRVMQRMRGKAVKKLTGRSWVHVSNDVHVFTSGDRSHSEADSIYFTLGCLIQELCNVGEVDKRISGID